MEQERKPRVAITHGDTNGVGYELIFKIFEDPMMLELCTPIIYGSPKVATYHRNALGMQLQFSIISNANDAKENRLNLLTTFDEEIKVELGQASDSSAEAARKALKRAMVDVQGGLADVDELRIALITNMMALKEVPGAITKEKIVDKCKIMHTSLRRDLRISNPRVAILSLNPPVDNDEKSWGEEEKEMIIPAIEELSQADVQAFGPFAADSFFGNGLYTQFDGVMAMYYNQGMAPLKSLAQNEAVSLVTGMPFVCTTPETEVGFDIAGRGVADESSLRQAIYLGIDVFRNRLNYDEPLANPLPKLYKEKRDDSEKIRFAIPKAKTEKDKKQ